MPDEDFDALLRAVARASLPAPVAPLGLPLGSLLADGRFRLVQQLGRGASGIVYEAYDAESEASVALKLLSHLTADSIYRLKNEFRALVDVQHRHLVRLHELFATDGAWFFTMERVHGVPFDSYVRPDDTLCEARLRAAFAQLSSAVCALHAAGQLHRDLKPSNVLVTTAGRVVVLDFGLTAHLSHGGVGQTLTEHAVCGTPAYMAPEQAAGEIATEASDFYALGVMLFEALTGSMPFAGSGRGLLAEKQRCDPPMPSVGDTLRDLAMLAHALLARDPSARPTAAELGTFRPQVTDEPAPRPAPPSVSALVGRADERALLRSAYRESLSGASVVINLRGESGVGKTSLAAALCDELAGERALTVLTSRCYERESIPFKVFDPLLDGVSRILRSPTYASFAPPKHARALARLFPVLLRVPAFAAAQLPDDDLPEILQQQAFDAFAELLTALRARGPLLLMLDDLQWADADSLEFLRHLLARPAPSFGLLVMMSRPAVKPDQVASLTARARENRSLRVHSMALGKLSRSAVEELVAPLIGTDRSVTLIDAVVQQADGNPYVALELARHAPTCHDVHDLTLAAALATRLAALPAGAGWLLDVLAFAGEPVPVSIALAAASAGREVLEPLSREKLVHIAARRAGRAGERTLECHHDRIRESLSAQLVGSARRALAIRLADALASDIEACPELWRRCLIEADRREDAKRIAILAGDRATEAHAFERAAALYEEALGGAAHDADERAHLTEKWALALEHAGRSGAAATAYRSAATLSTGTRQLELEQRAARQLLRTDQFQTGLTLLEDICRQVGVEVPQRTLPTIARIGWHAALLSRRPRRSVRASTVTPMQLDVAESLVIALDGHAPLAAVCAAGSYLRLAISSGDPQHIATALGLGALACAQRAPRSRVVRRLIAELGALADEWTTPRMRGYHAFVVGTVACRAHDYEHARRALASARTFLADEPGPEAMRDAIRLQEQTCATRLGLYADLVRDTPPAIDEAFRRGRIWLGVALSGREGLPAWLTVDDVDAAKRRLAEARSRWRCPAAPLLIDFNLLTADVSIALYSDQPELGLAQLSEHEATFTRSPHPWINGARSPGFALWRGRCRALALTATRSPSARRALTQEIARDAALLKRKGARFRVLSLGLEAALAIARGDHETGATNIRRLLATPDIAPRGVTAAAYRWCVGRLEGGAYGARLIADSRALMEAQGVRNCEAMLRMSCPGLT